MAEKSITDQIKHYQRDIDRYPNNSDRMIRCIQRLCIIPVTVQHLQVTGIGRSVNSLRKYGGEAADAAKALVAKWKAMVAAEESSDIEDGEDEPSSEKTREAMSSPDLNQSVIDNEDKSNLSYQSDSDHKPVTESRSNSSHKLNNVDKSNSESRKSSHSGSSEYKSSSKHRSDSDYKSSSEDKFNLENKERIINPSDKKTNSKHRESNGHRSSLDRKTNSRSLDHRNSSEHKSKSEKSSSSTQKSSSSNSKSKTDLKSHNKDKRNDEKTKESSDTSLKERNHRHSKDKHRSSISSSKERKRPNHNLSDDESSSSSRRKRKKSTDNESDHRTSKSRKRREDSCHENSDDSDSDEHDNEVNNGSESDDDGSRQSMENSASDNSNDNSDSSSEHSLEESNSSSSKKHINGHSSQTSDSDKDTESSSSNTSDRRYKHHSSSRHQLSEKSRRHTDDRKSHSGHKSSHRDKYIDDKRKTGDHKKSSYCKEFPVKIKQEKIDEPVIKKEKDIKSEVKTDRKTKDLNVKSSSSKTQKSSSTERKSSVREIPVKAIKIEKAPDGSIDCESGASFADALLGMSGSLKKSSKKKPVSTPVPNKPSSSSITHETSFKTKYLNLDSSNEPLLLKKNIKLEPLEVDLASTLPEITPNYRPLPHYSPPSSPVMKRSKLMSQEEALSSIMSTKNQRTKVFSGNKCSAMATVPSLFDFCIQVLRENIDALEYTGGVPYDVLKPVLDRATADQLYQLEHYNPYLIEDTDPLWAFHCNKDFRGKKREDLESWRDLYLRCLDERERKLKALTANISQSMAKSTPVRQTKLAYVDSMVKPPRNIARKQAKFGTANSNKHDIVSKAMVGAHSSTSGQPIATDVVPPPPKSSSSTSASSFSQNSIFKKKKAPLMAKALQLIKGNRFKR